VLLQKIIEFTVLLPMETKQQQKLELTKVDDIKYFGGFVIRHCASEFSIVTDLHVLYTT